MNKQLIEELRLDAEWWFSHKPSASPINDWQGTSMLFLHTFLVIRSGWRPRCNKV